MIWDAVCRGRHTGEHPEKELEIEANFYECGKIGNITKINFTLPNLIEAVYQKVAADYRRALAEILPEGVKLERIIFSGGAVRKNNSDGYYRWLVWDNWQDVTTIVKLPVAFLSEENAMRAEELGTLLGDYVTSESVKFITGTRPLSQVEDFQKELEGLGVEEYLEYYREGYASYMDSIF